MHASLRPLLGVAQALACSSNCVWVAVEQVGRPLKQSRMSLRMAWSFALHCAIWD